MGATGIYSNLSHANFFKEEIVPLFANSEQTIIKFAQVGKIPLNEELESSEFYLAVKNTEGRIYASVIDLCTIDRAPNKNEIIYRITDEDFGPHNYDCPIDILNILTPLEEIPDNEFAIRWRSKQRAKHNSAITHTR